MNEEINSKVIISDTSCLIALTDIEKLDVVSKLYKEVLITPEVAAEYKKPLPDWIIVKKVSNKNLVTKIQSDGLHIGESSAIALAIEEKSIPLVLDDESARKYALSKGLEILGTITIIAKAYDKGYIKNYDDVCNDLRKANFRFSQKIQDDALKNVMTDRNRGIDEMKLSQKKQTPKKKGFRR